MLHDFVEHGAEQFIKSVDTIPRVLLDNAETVAIEAGLTADNAELATPFATVSSIFSTETFAPLVFHVKYRDFLELFADKSTWADAAHILVGLLTSDVTPESFLAVLLVNALPLIQGASRKLTQRPISTLHFPRRTSCYASSKRSRPPRRRPTRRHSRLTTSLGSSSSSPARQAHPPRHRRPSASWSRSACSPCVSLWLSTFRACSLRAQRARKTPRAT